VVVDGRFVRVLPDEPAIGKTFDYLVPDKFGDQVRVGTRVRILLGGRRVGGWIVALDVEPPPGVTPRPLAKLSGWGPTPDLFELADWAAWRWAGRPAQFLRTANPERNVWALPHPPLSRATSSSEPAPESGAKPAPLSGAGSSFEPRTLLRQPPAFDPAEVALEAARQGNTLVICPNLTMAAAVRQRLRREGVTAASHPRDWALGAAGATVVGTRAAVWAPVADLAAIVVVDEHDEAHAQEQTPTWNARDVAIERARRAGVPCTLVSPCPSLEALAWAPATVLSRSDERAGWPLVDVLDRRHDDPRTGLVAPKLVDVLRSERRVLCVLNRVGRARLLACSGCGELARCEACDAALTQLEAGRLACPRCSRERPQVCAACGATRLKLLRQGVSRVREELEALVGEPVGEVSSLNDDPAVAAIAGAARVVVGTEAVLHQGGRADVVAFLDLDQELLAPRYRAAEQALGLLVRAARLVGGRAGGGRLVLQTRVPRHEAVLAALHADPTRVSDAEHERRELLRFPPAAALAEVSGPAAPAFVAALGNPPGIDVMGPADGRWLLRAPDHATLADALAGLPRPPGRLRLVVDPLRV
jgi:primosomal protein N' (replication factor Y)